MSVPEWVRDAIFYQIFPDRFANGDLTNDPPNVSPWGSQPTIYNFLGGDLQGVIQKFDYLVDLGVNAIYFNPIFQSPSNHRYNAVDYYKIDPKLGTLQDFHALLETAHRHDVRVILDGVFNHAGRGFFAFNDVLENGEHSPYKDWFHILHYPVDAYTAGEASDYIAWWRLKSLPKFNTANPEVRRYLLGVARYWIEQGADGWRLDVPNEIDDDSFWEEFRQVVRAANPKAYLLGEIWEVIPRWVRHFDGLMNYPLRTLLLEYLQGKIAAHQFGSHIEQLLRAYPEENTYAMYNTLGSHDTERIFTRLGQNAQKVKLAFLFLLAYPGAPGIYYGDEVGLEGLKDPDCRRAFPWDASQWKNELRPFVQQLIKLRKQLPALRQGKIRTLFSSESQNTYAFVRSLSAEHVIMAMNPNRSERTLPLPVAELGWADGSVARNLLGKQTYPVAEGYIDLRLPARAGVWIVCRPGQSGG